MRALTRAFAFLLVAFAASAVVLVHAQSSAVQTTAQAPQASPRPTDAQDPRAPHQQVLAPFSSDGPALERAIESTIPHGSTALYTSLYIAVEDLSRLARQQQGVRRQAIVVLTDGEDTSSMLSFDDLMDVAKRSAVAIYAIRITAPFDPGRMDEGATRFSTEADFALRSLATETGARSFFPFELKDLNGVYGQIAEELISQYSIAYMPKVHRDEAFHRLFVRVLRRADARPRTRSGYYSSRPLPASLIGGQD